jgi:hypothetical protein
MLCSAEAERIFREERQLEVYGATAMSGKSRSLPWRIIRNFKIVQLTLARELPMAQRIFCDQLLADPENLPARTKEDRRPRSGRAKPSPLAGRNLLLRSPGEQTRHSKGPARPLSRFVFRSCLCVRLSGPLMQLLMRSFSSVDRRSTGNRPSWTILGLPVPHDVRRTKLKRGKLVRKFFASQQITRSFVMTCNDI